ncbi:MAG: HAMP domain-containing protein [Acidobacteria bacterium]|nr:HAMP domain-containing protein [Acidobacteriota bacterium]
MDNSPNHLTTKQNAERGRKRLNKIILVASVLLLLLLSLIAQGGFNLSPFLSPETAGETLLLYALSTLNFFAFVTLLFVLLRNVIKLGRERRAGRAGSQFKARLVTYAIMLSLLPVALLFFFAYGLLNRSIDRWFGDPARQIAEDAKQLQQDYYKKEEADLEADARDIVRTLALAKRKDFHEPLFVEDLQRELEMHKLALVKFISPEYTVMTQKDDRNLQFKIAQKLNKVEQRLSLKTTSTTAVEETSVPAAVYFIAGLTIASAPNQASRLIVVREFPPELSAGTTSITAHHKDFAALKVKLRRIKATYTLLLAAVALLLVFSASWLALYVARGITVPIQALVEATDRVARGDFEQPVDTVAEDELAALVNAFNEMARMLAENRRQLERAAEDLQVTNLALDDRRRYIETVLESLSTGVISIDDKTHIATINEAATAMLGLAEKPEVGAALEALSPQGCELTRLCRRAWRSEVAQTEIEFSRPDGSALFTATTAIALRESKGAIEGWVIVIEDLSNLIQAERAAAWSEVARRMAHEIKNPLTPIQLSAERIIRNYKRGTGASAAAHFDEVVREGTATIVREVGALQRMVEEFSRFARLPEARPVAASLNAVVREALALYDERLNGIRLETDLAHDAPTMRLDTEQIKRVVVNLIDNAVEAIDAKDPTGNGNASQNGKLDKLIRIVTQYDKEADFMRLTVADSGHGIKPSDRDKLFLPKFSTRQRGTGLGLAIVSHIIADHKGRIRVEDNQPRGAKFIIELPVS